MSEWVRESVSDKHCQWSDSGPIKRHSHTSTLLSEIYFHPSKRCFLCSCSFYQSWAKILKVTVKKINVGQWPKVEVDVSDYYADLQEKIVKATDVNIFSQKSFLKEELTYCPSWRQNRANRSLAYCGRCLGVQDEELCKADGESCYILWWSVCLFVTKNHQIKWRPLIMIRLMGNCSRQTVSHDQILIFPYWSL